MRAGGIPVAGCQDPAACSPCVGVCRLDTADRCLGCGRSSREIAGWSIMSPAERAAVLERLGEPAAVSGAPPPDST